MSGFDISDYPDNTDKVLAAIYLDGPHDENDGMSRREIAYETDLRMDEEMEVLHNKAEMMVEDFEDPPVVDHSPEKAKCIRCDESKPVYLIKENNRTMCKDCYITAEGRPASCENCGIKSEQYLMLDSGIVCVHCLANHML